MSPKGTDGPGRRWFVLSVSPVRAITQHSGALIGRRRCEPCQNPSVRVRVIGALANRSHLGTTVTIQELPLRRAKDITFAFLLPEAFNGRNCPSRKTWRCWRRRFKIFQMR